MAALIVLFLKALFILRVDAMLCAVSLWISVPLVGSGWLAMRRCQVMIGGWEVLVGLVEGGYSLVLPRSHLHLYLLNICSRVSNSRFSLPLHISNQIQIQKVALKNYAILTGWFIFRQVMPESVVCASTRPITHLRVVHDALILPKLNLSHPCITALFSQRRVVSSSSLLGLRP